MPRRCKNISSETASGFFPSDSEFSFSAKFRDLLTSGVIAGLRKVYPHFSVMTAGLVRESEEKLRAHFCTREPRQRLDYIVFG